MECKGRLALINYIGWTDFDIKVEIKINQLLKITVHQNFCSQSLLSLKVDF